MKPNESVLISVTAVSGFSKPGSSYNIDNILKGQVKISGVTTKIFQLLQYYQIGDDAYFIARHVDEWSSGSDFEPVSPAAASLQRPDPAAGAAQDTEPPQARAVAQLLGTEEGSGKGNADVIGVADGVGGWRAYGKNILS